MKNNITISLLRVEDSVAVRKRMEDYAVSRDLQAIEYNQSIIKRLKAEDKNSVKCIKCGKEFQYADLESPQLCSSCLAKI
ncbi:MAG: hypothetical protein ACM3NR_01535 [Methanosarcina sp.]